MGNQFQLIYLIIKYKLQMVIFNLYQIIALHVNKNQYQLSQAMAVFYYFWIIVKYKPRIGEFTFIRRLPQTVPR
jgi:hypothetical protein